MTDCLKCAGKGTVPHTTRALKIDDQSIPDPWDFQKIELCDGCGGSGKKLAADVHAANRLAAKSISE